MKFTLSWLKEFLDTNESLENICQTLTSIGIEVENIIDRHKDLFNFIVVDIIETMPHPEADRLKICKVNDGTNILQIICGAQNARAGIKTILAPIGAIIPLNNIVIKKSKIRNIESEGMLCSASELLIDGEDIGIIEIDNSVKTGNNLINILGLDEIIIEVSITPNRGDCLGVYGIARDLAAANMGILKEKIYDNLNSQEKFPKEILINSEFCSGYYALYFNNIDSLTLPDIYVRRIKACGFNSHSPIIDLINYLTHSYNRPMHVYDAEKINDKIEVRVAKEGEKFRAIGGNEYILSDDLVIADSNKILALAGIIGGESSAYSSNTKNIVIEIALFDDVVISKTGRKYNINTDARYRFERKLDKLFMDNSIDILNHHIKKYSKITECNIVKQVNKISNNKLIEFEFDFIENLSGLKISYDIIKDILVKLGFMVENNEKILSIIVPSWRNDISIKNDIVEEILRIYGYDKLKLYKLPNQKYIAESLVSKGDSTLFKTKRLIAGRGFDEVLSWSFMSFEKAKEFDEINEDLILANPISKDLNYMRKSIIPNLLEIICKNNRRQFYNLSIFEIGNIYINSYIEGQKKSIAALRTGNISNKNIFNDDRQYDIYDIKSDCEAIINSLGFDFSKVTFDYLVPKYLHPHRSANLMIGKVKIGYFGQIHKNILNMYKLKNDIFICEIYPDDIIGLSIKNTKFFKSNFQSVRRDFAFIIDKDIDFDKVIRVLKSTNIDLITNIELFDIYIGNKLEENQKSIAFSITLQSKEKTLEESDIKMASDKIEKIMSEKLNGKIRDS